MQLFLSKRSGVLKRYRSRTVSRVIALALGWLITLLVWFMSAPAAPAQISPEFLLLPEFPALSTGDWWNPLGARRCGRLLCTRVLLYGDSPTFGPTQRQGVTIAAPITRDGEEQSLSLEERSRQIQDTFQRLVQETRQQLDPRTSDSLALWSPHGPALQHPQTPKLAIGAENEQTVIYVPKQPGYVQRTLATVTGFDVKQNRQTSKALLAEEWKSRMEMLLSQTLWGRSYDVAHPWGRPLGVVAIALIYGLLMIPFGFLNRWAKNWERWLRQQQQKLRGNVQLIDPEVASVEELDAATQAAKRAAKQAMGRTLTQDLAPESLGHAIAVDPRQTSPQQVSPNSAVSKRKSRNTLLPKLPAAPQTQKLSRLSGAKRTGRSRAQAATPASSPPASPLQASTSSEPNNPRVQRWLENLPTRSLGRQNILQQQRNLIQLGLRLLFWLQFSALWMSLTLIALVYPALRPYATTFLSQTIALPLIWMCINLVDKFCDLLTDRGFEQWAQRRQEFDPQSQRYALRADTYSTAVRGVTTIGLTFLGLYLTVRLFGINPAVLASAGFFGAALVLVARGVLQDMLNGALVLATDRYAVGDVISVGDVTGLVEAMNLYVTQVRAAGGRLVTIPNGQIQTVENLTKDWSRVEFEVAIAYETDVHQAFDILEKVAQQLFSEAEWKNKILESPSILGLERISHEGLALKVWIKTVPLQQWSVEREFRLRVKLAFDEAKITIGIPQQRLC